MKRFLSGDEAFAEGVRLARPQVISAYPITPQTVVVERLSEMVEEGTLDAQYVHVESEHSALCCAMGASATGARTFTATSSQGLLYMAEALTYVAGGRFPIVMMNANRSTALPWNIYGDQRDSLSLLDHGWIQVYAQDNQEALDLALMAYALAEHPAVMTPVMVNLDGFALTHTYESVEIPTLEQADAFLKPYETDNRFDFDHPVNIGYSAGPAYNRHYKYREHRDMCEAAAVIPDIEETFAEIFGRSYPGMIETYRTEDAEAVVITLGSVAGLVRQIVDELRDEGSRVGLLRIRYLRPMPADAVASALAQANSGLGVGAVGVLEKDISFGAEGTVYTNVNSALCRRGLDIPTLNYIGGLGGDDITPDQVRGIMRELLKVATGEGACASASVEAPAGRSCASGAASSAVGIGRGAVRFLGIDGGCGAEPSRADAVGIRPKKSAVDDELQACCAVEEGLHAPNADVSEKGGL